MASSLSVELFLPMTISLVLFSYTSKNKRNFFLYFWIKNQFLGLNLGKYFITIFFLYRTRGVGTKLNFYLTVSLFISWAEKFRSKFKKKLIFNSTKKNLCPTLSVDIQVYLKINRKIKNLLKRVRKRQKILVNNRRWE